MAFVAASIRFTRFLCLDYLPYSNQGSRCLVNRAKAFELCLVERKVGEEADSTIVRKRERGGISLCSLVAP